MKRTICILLLLLSFLGVGSAIDQPSLKTVVIDAGHGGKDSGCVSADGKTLEKNYTLEVAKALASKIRAGYPDVNVILTRSEDVYITLEKRTDIANKSNADLFISLHVDATQSKSANGFSVFVMGQSSKRDLYASNMEVCKRENSVVLLESDYSTTYQGFDPYDPESYIFMTLMQNAHLEQSLKFAHIVNGCLQKGPVKNNRGVRQEPFLVLWRTAMPSVLVEMGFISNPSDLAILRKKDNRTAIAECLFQAFKQYKRIYDGSININIESPSPTDSVPEVSPAEPEGNSALYAVQIFASSKIVDSDKSLFMGYEHKRIESGKLHKYFIALSPDVAAAEKELPKIRKKYPDAFVVKIEGESIVRVK